MKILLVDDEHAGRMLLKEYLEEQQDHQVTDCGSAEEALEFFDKEYFPVVLTDIKMPGMSGIELLRKMKETPRGHMTDVVLFTGYADMASAIQALRAGAQDYLLKPINLEELDAVLHKAAEHQSLLKDNYELTRLFDEKLQEATLEEKKKLQRIQRAYAEAVGLGRVGVFSECMREVVRLAERLHEDPSVPVLIEGETGTGKEIVARMIHYGRGDVTTEFVSINCSAISPYLFESELFGYEGGAFTGAKKTGQKGKFELAQGGTIFLDEIGDLPQEMQPKLLRVLQEREFYRVGGLKKIRLDVRVICSTNRDLNTMASEGFFRKDLVFRLNVGRIFIKPLRQRIEAIKPLANMFLAQYAKQKKRRFKQLHPETVKILEKYSWPGNIRELQNIIERAILLYDDVELKPEHLSFLGAKPDQRLDRPDISTDPESIMIKFDQDGFNLEAIELQIIKKAVALFDGNKSRAASYLGISRNTLHNKLSKADKAEF